MILYFELPLTTTISHLEHQSISYDESKHEILLQSIYYHKYDIFTYIYCKVHFFKYKNIYQSIINICC
jgi:hypothetical protein